MFNCSYVLSLFPDEMTPRLTVKEIKRRIGEKIARAPSIGLVAGSARRGAGKAPAPSRAKPASKSVAKSLLHQISPPYLRWVL